MKVKLLMGAAALLLSACVVAPYNPPHLAAGAVLGGATGALITHDARGAIGGALIGGALGSLVGYNSGYYRGDGYYGGRQFYRPAYGDNPDRLLRHRHHGQSRHGAVRAVDLRRDGGRQQLCRQPAL